jgi:integrase/recombinase XerD
VQPNHDARFCADAFGLLGLRIFEATGADIADVGEEHGHRSAGRSTGP